MAVVDFIIIGSMKSGSTTLSDYLALNGDISMCFPKEPQYFSQHYDTDIHDYEKTVRKMKKTYRKIKSSLK